MKQFFVNSDTMTAVKEVEEGNEGNFAVITTVDGLTESFDKEKLVELRTSVRGKVAKGDKNKSAKKLAFEIFEQITKPEKEKKKAKEKKPAKITKVSMARKILTDKITVKKADLAEAIGHDLQNCHTMISILKNVKRTKEPMFVSYNKSTTEYTLHETEDEMVEADKKMAEAQEGAKAKAEADEKARVAAEKKAAAETPEA